MIFFLSTENYVDTQIIFCYSSSNRNLLHHTETETHTHKTHTHTQTHTQIYIYNLHLVMKHEIKD
jgi:hypothetical protein